MRHDDPVQNRTGIYPSSRGASSARSTETSRAAVGRATCRTGRPRF